MPDASTSTITKPFVAGANHDLSKPFSKKKTIKNRSFATQTLKEKPAPKEPQEECPICMKRIGVKDFVVTKCGHKFCSKCIFTNFGKSQNGHNCPMCRTSFAPSFLKCQKFDNQQVADHADSVMDKLWNEDRKIGHLSRIGSVRRARSYHVETEYETYIQEHGYQNIPYLKMRDCIHEIVGNLRNGTEKMNKLHTTIDEFVVTCFAVNLSEKLKINT